MAAFAHRNNRLSISRTLGKLETSFIASESPKENFVRNYLKFDSGRAQYRKYTECEIYHENRRVVRTTDVSGNTRKDQYNKLDTQRTGCSVAGWLAVQWLP